MTPANFDSELRVQLYRDFILTARAPAAARLSEIMATPVEEIRASLERLASGRAIALQPASREVLFAPPLSAVPTPFLVRTGSVSLFAPCAWDALGIMAMLKGDGAVDSSCACCGESMTLEIRGRRLVPSEGLIHFALPAKQWWDNIAFT